MRAIVLIGVCALLTACGSSAPTSPADAALAQKSVHWTAADAELAEGERDFNADVNADSGKALVSWTFELQAGWLHLVQVDDVVYLRGDSLSLRWFASLSKEQAKKYAGRWISATKDELNYQVADGLTLPGLIQEFRGHLSARGRNGLPHSFDEKVASDEDVSGSFSRWNEPVHVRAPAQSTPLATILRG